MCKLASDNTHPDHTMEQAAQGPGPHTLPETALRPGYGPIGALGKKKLGLSPQSNFNQCSY